MSTKEAAATIREVAAARAASPALARSVSRAPLRSVYLLCLRSQMSDADSAHLDEAAAVLHRAKDQAASDGRGTPDEYLRDW